MTYIVIGLGNFGTALAERLTAMGHEVVGTDSNMQRVEELKNSITITICLDLTDAQSLNMLPLKDADTVFVTMGENFGASILSVALLRQRGVKKLVARATSKLHKTILEALGVDQVIVPEDFAADLLVNEAEFPSMQGSYVVNETHRFVESLTPGILQTQTIGAIDFSTTFGLQLVGIKRPTAEKNFLGVKTLRYDVLSPDSETILQKEDILLLYGNMSSLKKFWKEF